MANTLQLLAILVVPFAVWIYVADVYGFGAGTVSGIVAGTICLALVVRDYGSHCRRFERKRLELRTKLPNIYRVMRVPECMGGSVTSGTEIKIGDYAWEAEALADDGLIYLQGLNRKWEVVWHVGFRPDQVECVGPKPRSQYDWDYSWMTNRPECPFTVLEPDSPAFGLPEVKM